MKRAAGLFRLASTHRQVKEPAVRHLLLDVSDSAVGRVSETLQGPKTASEAENPMWRGAADNSNTQQSGRGTGAVALVTTCPRLVKHSSS